VNVPRAGNGTKENQVCQHQVEKGVKGAECAPRGFARDSSRKLPQSPGLAANGLGFFEGAEAKDHQTGEERFPLARARIVLPTAKYRTTSTKLGIAPGRLKVSLLSSRLLYLARQQRWNV
jgi:hypothetical protein